MFVTKIYQVVETWQNKCFEEFKDEMVEGWREADANPNKKVMGLVYKLLMNSASTKSCTLQKCEICQI